MFLNYIVLFNKIKLGPFLKQKSFFWVQFGFEWYSNERVNANHQDCETHPHTQQYKLW